MAFRPGTLTTGSSDPSTPSTFATSVAGSIERNLHDLVLAMTGQAPFDLAVDDADARARRALFVAIAQAVFDHLQQGAASSITVSPSGGDGHVHTIAVQVSDP